MKMTKLITLAGLMLNLSVAFAQTDSSASQTQGNVASEAEVVQYISKYVYELKKPYKVFHWFSGAGRNQVWSSPLSASNPSGYDHLVNLGRRFFNGFCSQKNPSLNPSDCDLADLQYGRGGYYGPALYTSLDPVATATYGIGNGPAWVLMQVQLPKGYRVIDTVKDSGSSFPPEIVNFFSQQGCNTRMSTLHRLITAGSENLNNFSFVDEKCTLAVRHILKDQIKMDGFFYSYSYVNFQGCSQTGQVQRSNETDAIGGYQGPFGRRALIITNPDRISPNDVKVFNSKTPDAKADRIAIASAFDISGTIGYSQFIKWQDITPKNRDPKIDKWLQENIIGCKEEVPYGPAGGAQ